MFSVSDFLDRAKNGAAKKLGLPVATDYALAKILGHKSQANVSNWRLGKSAPDERAIESLCKLSGDDPEHVAACIQSMRAANDDAAALWQRVADRLRQNGSASISFLAVLALLFVALQAEPVQAAPALLSSAGWGLCIMSTVVGIRLGIRLSRIVVARMADEPARFCRVGFLLQK